MKFNDQSSINELQKASLKSCGIVLNAIKAASDNGVNEITITSKDAGYAKDLFVFIKAGNKTITALFHGNKLVEVA